MTDIFLGFLNRSLAAGILILAVVLVRLVFKKAPRWLLCALWALAAVRLVLMPLLALGLLLLCGVRGTVLVSLMICISTPVATACTMFATRYDRNPLLSVNLVSLSTLCAVVTMPLVIALTSQLSQLPPLF